MELKNRSASPQSTPCGLRTPQKTAIFARVRRFCPQSACGLSQKPQKTVGSAVRKVRTPKGVILFCGPPAGGGLKVRVSA